MDGLLPAAYAARHWRPALDVLGVDRLDTADVVEILSELRRPPSWWARAYAALATAPDRDALGALPVPLAASAPDRDPAPDAGTGPGPDDTRLGVRMVTGPRGLLLPPPIWTSSRWSAQAYRCGSRIPTPAPARPAMFCAPSVRSREPPRVCCATGPWPTPSPTSTPRRIPTRHARWPTLSWRWRGTPAISPVNCPGSQIYCFPTPMATSAPPANC